jgi:hypothetical protein
MIPPKRSSPLTIANRTIARSRVQYAKSGQKFQINNLGIFSSTSDEKMALKKSFEFRILVAQAGVEPAQPYDYTILNPARLPVDESQK